MLKVYLRLEPGTPAGTYPIFLLEAEMAGSLTGRAALPAIADGALTIERDVAFDATADLNTAGHWQCEARESLPPIRPGRRPGGVPHGNGPGPEGSPRDGAPLDRG